MAYTLKKHFLDQESMHMLGSTGSNNKLWFPLEHKMTSVELYFLTPNCLLLVSGKVPIPRSRSFSNSLEAQVASLLA